MRKIFLLSGILCLIMSNVFSQNFENTNFTNKNYVNDVVKSGNEIWIATNGGILVRNATNNSVIKSFTTSDGLCANNINCITVAPNGDIWCGSYYGATKYDGNTWTIYNKANSGLSDDHIYDVAVESNGNVWLATSEGAIKFDGSNWTTYLTTDGLPDETVTCITIDPSQNIWVGTISGISKFDGSTWQSTTNIAGNNMPYISSIAYNDINDEIWVGMFSGAASYDGSSWVLYTTTDGLSNNIINDIDFDNGIVYFATNSGVSEFDYSNWTVYKKNDGLATDYVMNVYTDDFGNQWFGYATDAMGITKFNGSNWNTIITNPEPINNSIKALAVEHDAGTENSTLWIATYNGVSSVKNGNWRHFKQTDGLIANEIFDVAVDENKSKWFVSAAGVSEFTSSELWNVYTSVDGLVHDYVNCVAVDRDNNKWFGTSMGVSKYSTTTAIWENYSNSDGLVNDYVNCIAVDNQNNIWFGTNNGISKFDGINTWTSYIEADGLVSNSVHDIVFDKSDNAWIATANGVAKYDGNSWESFSISVENNILAIAIDTEGKIWVGADDGVHIYNGTDWWYFNTENIGLVGNGINAIAKDDRNYLWLGTYYGLSRMNQIPEPEITIHTQLPTNLKNIPASVDFKEQMLNFQPVDIQILDANIDHFQPVDKGLFTFHIQPTVLEGTVDLTIPANVASDLANAPNTFASTNISWDYTKPQALISSEKEPATSEASIPVEISFNENVTELSMIDFEVQNGALSNLIKDGEVLYSGILVPENEGIVSMLLLPDKVEDVVGNGNQASVFTIRYDITGPKPTISSSYAPVTSVNPLPVTVSFNEPVSGFDSYSIDISTGDIVDFVAENNRRFTFAVQDPAYEPLVVDIYEYTFYDFLGNPNQAASFTIEYTRPKAGVSQTDSLALVALYHATGGANWKNNTNWLTGFVETWYGVILVEKRGTKRVSELYLADNNLSGTLPDEIGDLTGLVTLDVQGNQIGGTIPETIGSLTGFSSLNLCSNQFTGNLPDELFQLSQLHELSCCYNNLTGNPPNLFNGLEEIIVLDIADNQFSGEIPSSIGEMPNLKYLIMDDNRFSGTIPQNIKKLSILEYIDISDNELSGQIPDYISDLLQLKTLYMANNQFSGSIPSVIGNMPNLQYISLDGNNLTGTIPDSFEQLSQLIVLDVNNNHLGGDFTIDINNLTNLKTLDISKNDFSSIPNMSSVEFDNSETWKGLLIHHNYLDFNNLIPSMSVLPQSSRYSPQKTFGLYTETEYLRKEDGLFIETFIYGSENQYTWYKNDIPISDAENQPYYIKESLMDTDFGIYRCEVTNTSVPGLTLFTSSIEIKEVTGESPVVINVYSPNADRNYVENEVIPVHVVFDKKISITGVPELELHLSTSNDNVFVKFTGLSDDGTALIFEYTVAEGQEDDDLGYDSPQSLHLLDAKISGDDGSPAITNLPEPGKPNSLSYNNDIIINASVYKQTIMRSDGTFIPEIPNVYIVEIYDVKAIYDGLYLAGFFRSETTGVDTLGLVKWNETEQTWTSVGNFTNGVVRTIEITDNGIYIAGEFIIQKSRSLSIYNLAKWNGEQWQALGDGTDGIVHDIVVIGSEVYAGGEFVFAGDKESNYFAHWKPIEITGNDKFCINGEINLSIADLYEDYEWRMNGNPLQETEDIEIDYNKLTLYNAAPENATSYTVVVSYPNSNIKSESSPKKLTAYPIPETPSIQSQNNANIFCENDSLLLTAASNYNSLKWYHDANLLAKDTLKTYYARLPGYYQVEVTDNNKCTAISSEWSLSTFDAPPTPQIKQIGTNDFILICTSPANYEYDYYKWYNADNPTSIVAKGRVLELTQQEHGQYYIEITNQNQCAARSVTIETATATAQKSVNLYPNPNTGSFQLFITADSIKRTKIYSVTGESINYIQTISKNAVNITLPAKATGIFFIECVTNKGVIKKKFYVE